MFMKKYFSVLWLLVIATKLTLGEAININPDPTGEPWIAGGVQWSEEEVEWYNSLQKFVPDPDCDPSELPTEVDNSKLQYFRKIFHQGKFANCAHAATIGYAFTYEANRIIPREINYPGTDIENEDNTYPVNFTYNYWCGGRYYNGSTIQSAVNTASELGIPSCSVWREVTTMCQ
jgi:hypothetical protein